jgi:hypothetical protein
MRRFFCVTGRHWPTSPEDVTLLTLDQIARLAEAFGPKEQSAKSARPANETEPDEAALHDRLGAAFVRNPRLRERWEGGVVGLSDVTRSGRDMSILAMLVAAGFSKGETRAALRLFEHGKLDDEPPRYFEQMWARTKATPHIAPEPPPEWEKQHQVSSVTDLPEDQRSRRPSYTPADHELPQVDWRDVRLSDWAGREVPEMRWILESWIPRQQVTGLYGIGGINKTDFLVQLLMARAAGLTFIGHQLEAGPAYGLFCEDTEAEIVRRASRIAASYGRSLADFPDVHFASLVGFDFPEFLTFDGAEMTIGLALRRFDHAIVQYGAGLATLDTIPDFFGGNEIVRRDVSRFMRKLDAISTVRGCAILYTAHPSIRGRIAGTLDSGSTAWEGKVRSRISLHDPGDEVDEDDKPKRQEPAKATDKRILTRHKSNYAPRGETLELSAATASLALQHSIPPGRPSVGQDAMPPARRCSSSCSLRWASRAVTCTTPGTCRAATRLRCSPSAPTGASSAHRNTPARCSGCSSPSASGSKSRAARPG